MSSTVVEEVKNRLDIVAVISDYLTLKKSGTSLVALCPFHTEKTPSFHVSTDKQAWYCFGCNEGGDVFGFVMRMDGMQFGEALKHLAKKAGVVLRSEDIKMDSEKDRLRQVNAMAARFFHEVLLRAPAAEEARKYIARRGLAQATVDEFQIGFAPDSWDAALIALKKKGFTELEMYKAGLVSRKEHGSGYFDRFRGRLMFTITDAQGYVVGFTARVLPRSDGSDAKEAKYINTQQTILYNKGQVLFGFDRARTAIKKEGAAIVVEGNMDLISSHQIGVRHVVASSGTALSTDQLQLLKRVTDRLIFSFDSDAAGERAARRAVDIAQGAGFSIRIVQLPPDAGKDPDECIQKNPAVWQEAIKAAVPFLEWLINRTKERLDFTDPDQKKKAAAELLQEVAKYTDPVEQAHWIKVLSELFHTPEQMLFDKVRRLGGATNSITSVVTQKNEASDRSQTLSTHIMAMVLVWPVHMADLHELMPDMLHPTLRDLYKTWLVYYNELQTSAPGAFRTWLGQRPDAALQAHHVLALELLAEKEYHSLSPDERRQTLVTLLAELRKYALSLAQRALRDAMMAAEKKGDIAEIQRIQQQLQTLLV